MVNLVERLKEGVSNDNMGWLASNLHRKVGDGRDVKF